MKRVRRMVAAVPVLSVGAIVVIALCGCSGTMRGMMQPGGETITFQFEETGMGHGTLRTVLPDGERFEGKHVYQSSTSFGTGLGTVQFGSGSVFGASFGTVDSYSGNVEAILFGDRTHTMKCRFRVVDPTVGMASGGIGVCQLSDEFRIPGT